MFFVGGIIMLFTLDLSFTAVLLCGLPIMAVMLICVLGKAIPIYGTVQKKLDKVNSVVQENVTGARVIKAYVREDYEADRFEAANGDLRRTNVKVLSIMAIMHPVLNIVMNAAVIAIIYIGGWKIINIAGTEMSAGKVMAAITYVTQVLMSIMMVTMLSQSISRALASVKRIDEIMDADPVILSGTVSEASDDIAVSFKGVSFRYPAAPKHPVLKDVNIDIKKGENFAIIGATGSGKTSLVSLIPRFYDATEGEVFVDGVNVKDYELSALRQKMSFVMQKSELFSGTIEENILMGKPDATHEEVLAAARTAQAAEFVNGFANGYNDYIAEKGASLSGGQKQRMSIARALVRRPEILILDDSTSALDLATEAKLRRSLNEDLGDTTVIMIAQRIASVREADRIAVIENGVITACAPHHVLMETSETYRDIYSSQMKNGGDM
jgi:ATP-binding cassette subfamily B protein